MLTSQDWLKLEVFIQGDCTTRTELVLVVSMHGD